MKTVATKMPRKGSIHGALTIAMTVPPNL